MLSEESTRSVIGRLCLPAALAALLIAPSSARADQFVLFDVTFPFSKMDADTSTPSQSHSYV